MTPKEFRKSKRIHYALYTIEQMDSYLEEYANIVLSIAVEKAEIKAEYMVDCLDSVSVCKDSILNCLKD